MHLLSPPSSIYLIVEVHCPGYPEPLSHITQLARGQINQTSPAFCGKNYSILPVLRPVQLYARTILRAEMEPWSTLSHAPRPFMPSESIRRSDRIDSMSARSSSLVDEFFEMKWFAPYRPAACRYSGESQQVIMTNTIFG